MMDMKRTMEHEHTRTWEESPRGDRDVEPFTAEHDLEVSVTAEARQAQDNPDGPEDTLEDEEDTDDHTMMETRRGHKARSRSPRREPGTSSGGRTTDADDSAPGPWRGGPARRVAGGTYASECERQARRLQEPADGAGGRAAPEGTWRINAPWRQPQPSAAGSSGHAIAGPTNRPTLERTEYVTAPWRTRQFRDLAPPTPSARPRPPRFEPSVGSEDAHTLQAQPNVAGTFEEDEEEMPRETDDEVDVDRDIAQDMLASMVRADAREDMDKEAPVDDPLAEATSGEEVDAVEGDDLASEVEVEIAEDEVGLLQATTRKSLRGEHEAGGPLDRPRDAPLTVGVLALVEAWEQEQMMPTAQRPAPPLDELSLMQTVSPAHMELQMLQAALEAMPLITQATRARMLGHRLAERYTTAHQMPDAAAGMRALLAVFEEGVPTHKLCPMDTDHQWVRDRWAVICGTLPEPVLREEGPVEVEDSQPKEENERTGEVNHTDMAHQRAFAANLREEQACLEQALREVPASSASAPAVVAPETEPGRRQALARQPEDRRYHLLGTEGHHRRRSPARPGGGHQTRETVRLQFELRVEVDGEGLPRGEHQGPPQNLGDAPAAAGPGHPDPPRAQGITATTERSDHQPARQRHTVWAYSALPPTPPKCAKQTNLHASGIRPSGAGHREQNTEPETEPDEETPPTTRKRTAERDAGEGHAEEGSKRPRKHDDADKEDQ